MGWGAERFGAEGKREAGERLLTRHITRFFSPMLPSDLQGQGAANPYYPTPGYEPQGAFAGAVAPYSQHAYYPQAAPQRGGGGGYGGYEAYYN
jgi:hypothetical protein